MLFLLKRTPGQAALGLLILTILGLGLRALRGEAATPLGLSAQSMFLGIAVFLSVLCCDGLLHGTLTLCWRDKYLRRFHELANVFRRQSGLAIALGALMAGIGEELVFRGLGTEPVYLIGASLLFGLLHHLRPAGWPFTLWSIWEGILFAVAVWFTGALLVTMVAHLLHDVTGFLIFRHVNPSERNTLSREHESKKLM